LFQVRIKEDPGARVARTKGGHGKRKGGSHTREKERKKKGDLPGGIADSTGKSY